MSSKKKKSKEFLALPKYYQEVHEFTQTKYQRRILVQDKVERKWIMYRENGLISLMEQGRHREIHGLMDLHDRFSNDDLLDLHSELYGRKPSLKRDKMGICIYIIAKICSKAKDRTEWAIPQNAAASGNMTTDPRSGPRQSLKGRMYCIMNEKPPKGIKMPPQAMICFEVLAKTINTLESEDNENSGACTEEQFRNALMTAQDQGQLKTKQDPWRIFQYYRAQLVKHGMIKHD